MAAYAIAEIHVTDPEAYQEYKAQVGETIAAFGGRYLARGGAASLVEDSLSDGRPPARVVILEFPDMARLKAWQASDLYAPAKAVRHRAALSRIIAVEGLAGA
jgi:uncharacterized protein (DUF1330 family)